MVCAIKPPRHPASSFGFGFGHQTEVLGFFFAQVLFLFFLFYVPKSFKLRLLFNKVKSRLEVLEKDTLTNLKEQNLCFVSKLINHCCLFVYNSH